MSPRSANHGPVGPDPVPPEVTRPEVSQRAVTRPQVPDYRRRVISSLAWQGSAQLFGQITSWASTIIVVRLLDPSDYGVMAMATVFLSFLLMLSDLGIGAAIVQADELDEEETRSIQGFVFVFTLTGFVVTLLGSGLVARFFDEPRLVPVLSVLSVCLLLMALYVMPQSLLMRDLRFDLKARVDFATLAVAALVSLGCALAGLGVWSLVAGTVATHAVRAVGFNWVGRGFVVPRLSFSTGSPFLRFGSIIAVDRILWFLYANMDIAIAGKLLGKELLGFYSVALTLSAIPMDKVVPVLTQVSFPAFSRIQHDRERVKRSMVRALRYAALVFLPIFWGMALVARDAVPLVLGEKWQGAVVPFELLCVVLPLKALAALLPPALFGVGRPLVNVVNMAIHLAVMSVAFYIGARSGLTGLATAWVVAYPGVFAVTTTRALRALGVSWGELWRGLWTALGGSTALVAGVVCVQWGLSDAPAWARLAAAIPVGALCYVGLVWLADRAVVSELRELLARSEG